MTGFRRGVDPPFWWKPWLRLYWITDWWLGGLRVSLPRASQQGERAMAREMTMAAKSIIYVPPVRVLLPKDKGDPVRIQDPSAGQRTDIGPGEIQIPQDQWRIFIKLAKNGDFYLSG